MKQLLRFKLKERDNLDLNKQKNKLYIFFINLIESTCICTSYAIFVELSIFL